MPFEDKTIKCADCGADFIHSADDQARYAERGFKHEPKRCRECREKRKAEGGGEAGAPRTESGSMDRPRSFGGGGGRGPRPGPGGGGRGPRGGGGTGAPRESFEAVCAECGAKTTVPFKPSQGRPVLCRDCYRSKRR